MCSQKREGNCLEQQELHSAIRNAVFAGNKLGMSELEVLHLFCDAWESDESTADEDSQPPKMFNPEAGP